MARNKIVITEHRFINIVGEYPITEKVLNGLFLLARKFGKKEEPARIDCWLEVNRIRCKMVYYKIPVSLNTDRILENIYRACGRRASLKAVKLNQRLPKLEIIFSFKTPEACSVNNIAYVEREEKFAELEVYRYRYQ